MKKGNTLRAEIRKTGESLAVQGDRNVVTKKNPARDALEKIRPQSMRLMKEFNMTPSSRKSVGSTLPSGTNDGGYGDV